MTNTPEIHNQAGQGMIPNMRKVARGARQAKKDRMPYSAPGWAKWEGSESSDHSCRGVRRRTTSSKRRKLGLFLNGRVPPDAREGGYKTGAEVESEEAGVAERIENGWNGEIVRETVEEQMTDVFL